MAQMVKNLPVMQETQVQSLVWEDSPGEGHGNPLQYSCLDNSMDRGAYWAIVHGVAKELDATFKMYTRCTSWVSKRPEEPEIKFPTFAGSWRKQGNSRKISASASLTMLKPFTVYITTNCGKFLNRWEYQTTLPIF